MAIRHSFDIYSGLLLTGACGSGLIGYSPENTTVLQKVLHIPGVKKIHMGIQFQLRVNIEQSLPHHNGLIPADNAMGTDQLPIDIGNTDSIVINNGDLSDAGSGYRFGYSPANPTQANDQDMGIIQLFQTLYTLHSARNLKSFWN